MVGSTGGRAGSTESTGRDGSAGNTGRAGRAESTGKAGSTGRTGNTGRAGNAGGVRRARSTGKAGCTGRAGRTGKVGSTASAESVGGPGSAGSTGSTRSAGSNSVAVGSRAVPSLLCLQWGVAQPHTVAHGICRVSAPCPRRQPQQPLPQPRAKPRLFSIHPQAWAAAPAPPAPFEGAFSQLSLQPSLPNSASPSISSQASFSRLLVTLTSSPRTLGSGFAPPQVQPPQLSFGLWLHFS